VGSGRIPKKRSIAIQEALNKSMDFVEQDIDIWVVCVEKPENIVIEHE